MPTICLEDLTKAEIRAYIIADNKLAENAGWDRELLAIELQDLEALDFDVTLTGFDVPEIDIIIGELNAVEEDDPADEVPLVADGFPVTRPGDIWCIGKHRLICGNATDPGIYVLLLGGGVIIEPKGISPPEWIASLTKESCEDAASLNEIGEL